MGADISQSQQLRNLYPLSQYKILPSDPLFPNLTIIQRIHDSAVFAVANQHSSTKYVDFQSPHIIKRTQKHEIHNKFYGMYEWATANVIGLVQYVTQIDKSRKISVQQYKSIVQGSIRAYSTLASNGSQLDCLNINMQNLRIFNEVNIKRNSSNQKQVINSLMIKAIPPNLIEKQYQKQKNLGYIKWKNVGQCIHRDGILTEKELLGQYLLQLSNYANKCDYSNNNDSLAKLSHQFGSKYEKIIKALLDNQSWTKICSLLSLQQEPKKEQQKKADQKKENKQDNKQNKNKPSEKTLPCSNKNISQQNLFKIFGDQTNLPLVSQRSILQNNAMRSRITSIGNFKSLSPLKTQRIHSPPSIKVIRDVTPPKVNKNYQPLVEKDYATVPKLPTPQLQKVNSRLVMHPDILQQTAYYNQNTNRPMYQQQSNYFSPRQQKSRINYFNSPEKTQKPSQTLKPQKRKGKKIVFETSSVNKPLEINVQKYKINYQMKSFPDVYSQQNEIKKQEKKKDSQTSFFEDNIFDSKQFNKKYNESFFQKKDQSSLIKSFAKAPPKQKTGGKYQGKIKLQNDQKNTYKNVLNHESLGIKQAQSEQMIVIDQNQHIIKHVSHVNPSTQSRYIGTLNMNGQKQGQGKLYFPSGGSYIGQFYKDFMHGKGKLYYPSGKLAYDGIFKYDKFHDYGKLYNENPKHINTFDFRNFNKLQVTEKQQPIHREHHLISPIQKQKKLSYWKYYEGEMSYDMKHGKGVLVLQNDQRYQGQFKNDLVSGIGVFHGKNGNINGKWDDNLLIEVYR